jgi:TniQ
MVSFIRLATTFPAAPGEGLLSWLSRLCAANDISPSEFCSQIIGRGSSEFAALATRDEHALALGCVTGFGAAGIGAMMHSCGDPVTTAFFDQLIPWSALERSKRRIAPGRLATDRAPFLRALWSLRMISCDPTSGERLVNRCTCGQPLWWSGMHELLECGSCGQDIRLIPAAVGTSDEIEVSRFWASIYSFKASKRIEARSMLDPALKDCDSVQLLNIAEFLGTVDEFASDRSVESGTLILKGWPQSGHHLAAWRRGSAERTMLGFLSQSIRCSVSGPSFEPLTWQLHRDHPPPARPPSSAMATPRPR